MKSWSCTSCAFIPISLRPFPPLAKGGLGGVVPARPVTRSFHVLSLSVLSHPSREARRIVLDYQGSRINPPASPSQGGNSVRLDFCYGQRFMVVDLRADCQYGQQTAKLTV